MNWMSTSVKVDPERAKRYKLLRQERSRLEETRAGEEGKDLTLVVMEGLYLDEDRWTELRVDTDTR